MNFFRTAVLLIIGLIGFLLKRDAKRQVIRQNAERTTRGRSRERATRAAEKQFDADAIDTLESEGGLVTTH